MSEMGPIAEDNPTDENARAPDWKPFNTQLANDKFHQNRSKTLKQRNKFISPSAHPGLPTPSIMFAVG